MSSCPLYMVALLLPSASYYPYTVASMFRSFLLLLVLSPGTLNPVYVSPQIVAADTVIYQSELSGAGSRKLCAEPFMQTVWGNQISINYKQLQCPHLLSVPCYLRSQ